MIIGTNINITTFSSKTITSCNSKIQILNYSEIGRCSKNKEINENVWGQVYYWGENKNKSKT